MADEGNRKSIRIKVATLLAQGGTVRFVAKETGVGERTIFRWMRGPNPKFRNYVARLRKELLASVNSRFVALLTKATSRLQELVDSEDDRTALQAAKQIVEGFLAVRSACDVEERLTTLEQNSVNRNPPRAA